MPRIRTIKPDFWEDDVIGLLSRDARLLFIATWNLADDEGRLRWSAPYLKASAFMYDDDIDNAVVERLMTELEGLELVRPYRAGKAQQPFATVTNFARHQKINRPSASKLPDPNGENVTQYQSDKKLSEPLTESVVSHSLTEGEGEGERERESRSSLRSDLVDSAAADPPDDIPARMVEIWNEELGDLLARPRRIDKTRRGKLLGRYRDTFGRDLENWRRCCQRIRGSPHLTGDNERGWRADIDFALTPNKLTRIAEGFYDVRKPNGPTHAANQPASAVAAVQRIRQIREDHASARPVADGGDAAADEPG